MLIDCDSCVVKGLACGDCVVSVMFGSPPTGVELDDEERRALGVLADAGLLPRLRLVTPVQAGTDPPIRGVTGRAASGAAGGSVGGGVVARRMRVRPRPSARRIA
jgi:hypothetical protein